MRRVEAAGPHHHESEGIYRWLLANPVPTPSFLPSVQLEQPCRWGKVWWRRFSNPIALRHDIPRALTTLLWVIAWRGRSSSAGAAALLGFRAHGPAQRRHEWPLAQQLNCSAMLWRFPCLCRVWTARHHLLSLSLSGTVRKTIHADKACHRPPALTRTWHPTPGTLWRIGEEITIDTIGRTQPSALTGRVRRALRADYLVPGHSFSPASRHATFACGLCRSFPLVLYGRHRLRQGPASADGSHERGFFWCLLFFSLNAVSCRVSATLRAVSIGRVRHGGTSAGGRASMQHAIQIQPCIVVI